MADHQHDNNHHGADSTGQEISETRPLGERRDGDTFIFDRKEQEA